MTLKWGRGEEKPSPADRPRKPRGSERPGHARENLVITAILIFVAAMAVLAVGTWGTTPPADSTVDLKAAGTLLFGTAVAMLVSMGLWLFLDLRTPILIVAGASSIGMLVLGLASPVFLVLLPTALAGVWAGLSALGRHPRDRWTAVAIAVVLSLLLGKVGTLLFAPVAIAAALIPMLDLGEGDGVENEADRPES